MSPTERWGETSLTNNSFPLENCELMYKTDEALSLRILAKTVCQKPPTSKKLSSTVAVEVTKHVNLSPQHYLFNWEWSSVDYLHPT